MRGTHGLIAATALLLLAVSAPPAAAEGALLVVDSTLRSLLRGSIIPDWYVVRVPRGDTVALIDSTGSLLRIEGPFEGTVEDRSLSIDHALLDTLSHMLRPQRISREKPQRLAETDPGPSPWTLVARAGGRFCVRRGLPLSVERPKLPVRGEPHTFGIRPEGTPIAEQRLIRSREGETLAPWPAGLPLRLDQAYLRRDSRGDRDVPLEFVAVPQGLPSTPHLVLWMLQNGCRWQARRLLDHFVLGRA